MVDFYLQGQITDASNIARKDMVGTVPGIAHFAGRVPAGATCANCTYWQPTKGNRRSRTRRKFEELRPKGPTRPVPGSKPSCRYFEEGGR